MVCSAQGICSFSNFWCVPNVSGFLGTDVHGTACVISWHCCWSVGHSAQDRRSADRHQYLGGGIFPFLIDGLLKSVGVRRSLMILSGVIFGIGSFAIIGIKYDTRLDSFPLHSLFASAGRMVPDLVSQSLLLLHDLGVVSSRGITT